MELVLRSRGSGYSLRRFILYVLFASTRDDFELRRQPRPSEAGRNWKAATDLELVAGLRSGEHGASAEFVRRFEKLVTYIAYGHTYEKEEVEDLVQDVWVVLSRGNWRTVCAWENKCPLSSYVSVITTRVVRARMRRRPNEVSIEELDAEPVDSTVIVEPLLTSQQAETIQFCIRQLSAKQQLVLKLRIVDGADHIEIGRLLGISPTTSRKRLFDALRKLAKLIPEVDPSLMELEI